ncbi:MAG: recombinase family protein, partial [Parcubacteria group bacterium]
RGYVLQLSDNIKRTIKLKLQKGEAIGQAKLGYVVVHKEHEPNGRAFDPERSHHIIKIYDLYLQGWSFQKISDEMYKQGLRSRYGNKVSKSNIQYILKDPFYSGLNRSKGKLYPHYYPQLIPPDVFAKVQEKMSERTNNTTKTRSKIFALSRLIKCKKCNGLISAMLKKGRLVYYSCSNYKGICKRIYIREEELIEPVQKLLKSLVLPQDVLDRVTDSLKRTNEAKTVFQAEALNALRIQYDKKQVMLDKIIDLLADGSITQDDYDRKLKQYKEDQRETEVRMQEYTDADEQYHITAKTVLSLAQRAREIFESSEVHEKQQLLGYLLQNATLNDRKLDFTVRKPFNLLVNYSSRPNLSAHQDSNLEP